MQLKVLGSSSKGNCYLLDDGEQCLMVECGVSFKDVQKAVNFDISRIVGAVVTHEHGDHAKYVEKCIEYGISVFMSDGTRRACLERFKSPYLSPLILEAGGVQTIGNFKVFAFDTEHDAAQPFGFLIYHPQMGKLLFATDTNFLKYTFDGLNNILIECNYRQDILEANVANGLLHPAMAHRTYKSHMGFETCLETLLANDLSGVNNIVLIHLSGNNSHADEFKQDIENATAKTVTIAEPGLTIDNFNKSPF